MNNELMGTLKALADKRMEISLLKMQSEDPDRREEKRRLITMETKYESMDLEKDIRDFIDTLLSTRDSINMENVSLAYLAGMKDCVMILRELGMLEL